MFIVGKIQPLPPGETTGAFKGFSLFLNFVAMLILHIF